MSNERSSISKARGTILEEVNHISNNAKEAVLSGGWYYPLYGVVYFISHPSLYQSLAPLMLKSALASLGITIGMFAFTYLPQVAFCALFSGPLAVCYACSSFILGQLTRAYTGLVRSGFCPRTEREFCDHSICGESLCPRTSARQIMCVSLISYSHITDGVTATLMILVDAVMIQQGHADVIQRGREIKSSNGVKTLGKSITSPLSRFSKAGIIRYIISLPLNALPFIGTALFLLYNGGVDLIFIQSDR